jgi:hypothetical protein
VVCPFPVGVDGAVGILVENEPLLPEGLETPELLSFD